MKSKQNLNISQKMLATEVMFYDFVDPALLHAEKLAASLVGLLGAARCRLPCGRTVVEREREDSY